MPRSESPSGRSAKSPRAFYLAYTSVTVSAVGTAVTSVALPLVAVFSLDASTFEVGAVAAATFAAWLVIGLPSGVIVSKFPLRASLVTADLARAFVLLTVPVAAAFDVLTVAQLIVVAALVGVFTVLFDVAFSSFLPSVVADEDLTARNSLVQGSESVAATVGPAGGGALVQLLGAAASLLVDVASYLVSAACLFALGRPPADVAVDREDRGIGFLERIREGVRYVRRDEIVGPLTLAATALNFTGAGVTAIGTVFLARTLGLGPLAIGVLLAVQGVGGVLGAAAATPLVARLGSARTVLVTMVAAPVSALLVPLAHRGPALTLWVLGNLGLAAATVAFSIVARVHRQRSVPAVLLPRVMATVRFVSWGVAPIGALVAGTLGEILGVRAALVIVCAALLLGLVPVLASPIRSRRDLLEPAAALPVPGVKA